MRSGWCALAGRRRRAAIHVVVAPLVVATASTMLAVDGRQLALRGPSGRPSAATCRPRPRPRTCSGPPRPASATSPAQTPGPALRRAARRRRSCQWFQSPTTDTLRAFGAQTAKVAPGSSSDDARGRRAPPTAAGGGPRRSGGDRRRRAAVRWRRSTRRRCYGTPGAGPPWDRRAAERRPFPGRRAPQAAGYVGPPCEWPCCRGSTHRSSSAASRPTWTAWPERWPGPGTRSSSSPCTTPTPPTTRSSTACGWSGPAPSCPGCPTTTSSPTWPGPTTTWSQLAARLDGWRPDVVHAHDWLVAWAGDTLHMTLGRAPRRHHPRHRARPRRRPPVAGPVDGHQQRRVVAHVRGHAGHLLLHVHARRGGRRLPAAGGQGRRGAERRRPGGLGPGPARRPPRERRSRSSSRGDGSSTRRASRRWSTRSPEVRLAVPGVRAVIAGRGSYLADLRATAQAAGVADICDFPGFVPDDELKHLLHEATVRRHPQLLRAVRHRRAGGHGRRRAGRRGRARAGWSRSSTAPAPASSTRPATPGP